MCSYHIKEFLNTKLFISQVPGLEGTLQPHSFNRVDRISWPAREIVAPKGILHRARRTLRFLLSWWEITVNVKGRINCAMIWVSVCHLSFMAHGT